MAMTTQEVGEIVRMHADGDFMAKNNHGITLQQALVPPQRISVIDRRVQRGRVTDQKLNVWLVGQEGSVDGYKIIMRDDGLQFGLASSGFPTDRHPILVGWYGSLMSAFMGM
jgi:hypothetical protein